MCEAVGSDFTQYILEAEVTLCQLTACETPGYTIQ